MKSATPLKIALPTSSHLPINFTIHTKEKDKNQEPISLDLQMKISMDLKPTLKLKPRKFM
jgi:hypothetical protein